MTPNEFRLLETAFAEAVSISDPALRRSFAERQFPHSPLLLEQLLALLKADSASEKASNWKKVEKP